MLSVFLKSSARSFAPLCWSDSMINFAVFISKGIEGGNPCFPSLMFLRRQSRDEKTCFFRGAADSLLASEDTGFFSSFWRIFRIGAI